MTAAEIYNTIEKALASEEMQQEMRKIIFWKAVKNYVAKELETPLYNRTKSHGRCSRCEHSIWFSEHTNYCENCGQKIDWEKS